MNNIQLIKQYLYQLTTIANKNSIINISTVPFFQQQCKTYGIAYSFSGNAKQKKYRPNYQGMLNNDIVNSIKQQSKESETMTKQQVLKTYLQIIPPQKLQMLLQPEKTDLSEFMQNSQQKCLSTEQMGRLFKKLKKSVHMVPIETLTSVLQVIQVKGNQDEQYKKLSRKIGTKIIATVKRKLNRLDLQDIVNFMYKLVKLNYKEFEFMKDVESLIIQEKIRINYPLIRKILWSYTHLDVGSTVLYAHVARTLKVGQHQFSALELAESAYMLSKTSENATGGFGVFGIAEKHLLTHFPRFNFHDLVKAASYMLTQNLGTNDFQTELEAELYKKYPDRPNLRINDLVALLKATSAYYFKFKEKALLNILQGSTQKFAHETNLQQFEDFVWSWGRSGKGDRELWKVLEEQINKKFINLLKPRQLAFFYFSLCSTEYSSAETINVLQNKFLQTVNQNPNIDEHYLLKFLFGMQKKKNYSQKPFATISQMITDRLPKLSTRELVTFVKIINESDLCYQNKENFKEMEISLNKVCESAITQKIYMFRLSQIIEILYMWIKLDISDKFKPTAVGHTSSEKFIQTLFNLIKIQINDIPKSSFIKGLFCFTIKDKYSLSIQMVTIMQQLLKFGNISYFFSPLELPLAAYSVFHLVVNSGGKITFKLQLLEQLANAMDKMNPVILNKFVRNGYDQCARLIQKYRQTKLQSETQDPKNRRRRK